MNRKRAYVLLVEDSKPDQVIIKRTFEDGEIACDIHLCDNGEQALAHLNECKLNPEQAFPDLILMDINMPVMDGREALKRIRSDEELKHIPIIMLTTSSREKDVLDSYANGVNAFITKPLNPTDFISVVQKLEYFWFKIATLPPKNRA